MESSTSAAFPAIKSEICSIRSRYSFSFLRIILFLDLEFPTRPMTPMISSPRRTGMAISISSPQTPFCGHWSQTGSFPGS